MEMLVSFDPAPGKDYQVEQVFAVLPGTVDFNGIAAGRLEHKRTLVNGVQVWPPLADECDAPAVVEGK